MKGADTSGLTLCHRISGLSDEEWMRKRVDDGLETTEEEPRASCCTLPPSSSGPAEKYVRIQTQRKKCGGKDESEDRKGVETTENKSINAIR